MFLNNLTQPNKEKVRDAVLAELETIGLKHDLPKKAIKESRRPDGVGRIFRTPLDRLPMTTVRLHSGVDVEIPSFVNHACQCIITNANVEGIFRKAGSAARQKEIRNSLDAGHLESLSEHHVIDIAGVLKLFLRELPDPLLPLQWHNSFVRCLVLGENTSPSVLLTCLLLPPAHLAVLAYLMQFFQEVASHSDSNKMDRANLAIILTPTVMPVQAPNRVEKAPAAALRLNNHVQIIEILMKHAKSIGMVPEYVSGPIEPSSSSTSLKGENSLRRSLTRSIKRRRRRSGSLTRVLSGLRKIVGRSSPEESVSEDDHTAATEFSTPCVKPSKKRKAHDTSVSGLSAKKKREVLQSLPQNCPLADTPFTPAGSSGYSTRGTPAVSGDPSPTREDKLKNSLKHNKRRFFGSRSTSESDKNSKKSLLSVSGKVTKKSKRSEGGATSHGGGFLERSWSAVSNTSNWGRRKLSRLSLLSSSAAANQETDSETLVEDSDGGVDLSLSQNNTVPSTPVSPPVVCLSARQYADIERRMSDIETRISTEMKQMLNVAASTVSPEPLRAADTVQAVQCVYERTLEGSERLVDTSADQLARRLGQQLKIRRRSEARVIRSPSARKIGSLRRELRRNKSWHTLPVHSHGSGSLRRGKPNTVASGLPQHAPNRIVRSLVSTMTGSPVRVTPQKRSFDDGRPTSGVTTRRALSFHVAETASHASPNTKKCSSQTNLAKEALMPPADEKWCDAVEHFRYRPKLAAPVSDRDSIARLRSQNAGMVLAKARLFGAAAGLRTRPTVGPQTYIPHVKSSTPTQVVASSPMEGSSEVSTRILRPRPSPVAALEEEDRRLRKHNSLRMNRAEQSHQPVRRNLSVPSHWRDASKDKENRIGMSSPSQRNASPLKNSSNRIAPTTPAPEIKAPLGSQIPRRVISTPRSGPRGRPTPLRALATPTGMNSPRHRSPRVAMGARALSVRSRH